MKLSPTQKDRCLAAANTIAERLIKESKRDEDGVYWEFTSQSPDLRPVTTRGLNLYGGVSGVALFFAELYQHTGDAKHLATARAAFDWIVVQAPREEHLAPAYITGRIGIANALCRFADISGEPGYRDHALAIVEPTLDPVDGWNNQVDDMLNGRSGTMLGLIHLHAATREPKILDAVLLYADYLLKHAWPGAKGIYWYRTQDNISGLCGFSHGAAGNGFVFNELAWYLDAPEFNEPGRLAFAYENQFFNDEHQTWADLRKGIFNQDDEDEHLEHYESGNDDFFHEPRYMDAWCHGGPGIGLSRLAHFYRTGEEAASKDLHRALAATAKSAPRKVATHTLCHGLLGDLELPLEASRLLDDPDLVDPFIQTDGLLEGLLDDVEQGKKLWSGYAALDPPVEDLSLFMGIAGIGYGLLRWCDPHRTPSVLFPILTSKAQEPCTVGFGHVREYLLHHFFERSLTVAREQAPGVLNQFLAEGSGFDKDPYDAFQEWAVDAATLAENPVFQDILTLEREILRKDREITSLSFFSARALAHAKRLIEREDQFNNQTEVVSHPGLSMIQTQFNWTEDGSKAGSNPQPTMVMLLPTASGIVEETLTPFSQAVFTACEEPVTVDQIVEQVADLFDWETKEEYQQIVDFTHRQVLEGLRSGVLFYADQPLD
jgi:hypothetical protein